MEEPDGFREFVDAHSRGLLRAGWLLTGNWASAEDLVQTALAAAWPRWATIRRVESAEAYVQKIMVTTFLRWQRRRWVGEIPTNPLPDRHESADAWAVVDCRQPLLAAVSELPPRQRAVIVLRYFVDMSESQVAEILGCSVGSVRSNTGKALARLRATPGLADITTGGLP
jgi:RNA polymerase sigma-70 factor (sigma-E family)